MLEQEAVDKLSLIQKQLETVTEVLVNLMQTVERIEKKLN